MTLWREDEFEVMAQHRRGDPVHVIGSVWAPNSILAGFYAATTYDAQRWHTLYAIKRSQKIPVIIDGRTLIGEERV
jgi:hypothetical protein